MRIMKIKTLIVALGVLIVGWPLTKLVGIPGADQQLQPTALVVLVQALILGVALGIIWEGEF